MDEQEQTPAVIVHAQAATATGTVDDQEKDED